MTQQFCDSLDNYLSHDLSGQALEDFLLHVETCAACQSRIEEGTTLDRMLTAAFQSEPVPDNLMQRVVRARRQRVLVLGAVAASVLLTVSVWWSGQEKDSTALMLPIASLKPWPTVEDRPRVRVVAHPRDSGIAVQVETDDPTVTMVWIYRNRAPGNPLKKPTLTRE